MKKDPLGKPPPRKHTSARLSRSVLEMIDMLIAENPIHNQRSVIEEAVKFYFYAKQKEKL